MTRGIGVPSRRVLPPIERPKSTLASDYAEAVLKRAATTDASDARALDRYIAMLEASLRGGNMPATYETHKATLRAGLARIAAERKSVDARASSGEILPAFADSERNRLRVAARDLDRTSTEAVRATQAARSDEARRRRARSEAERDAAARQADLSEMQVLVADRVNGDEYAARAASMVAAGQPARARLYAAVADMKGARVSTALLRDIDDGLDVVDTLRADARAIEDALAFEAADFDSVRLGMLAEASVGVAADGTPGSGHPGEIAAAHANSQMAAYAAGAKSFPVGDGTNK